MAQYSGSHLLLLSFYCDEFITSTVVRFTFKFKPLKFPVLGFVSSNIVNIFILTIL